jgi:hypothetical protein
MSEAMGQIRTPDCEIIDQKLRECFPAALEIETQKDTYSLDYMIWITIPNHQNEDVVHPIRITVEEYEEGVWLDNVRESIRLITGESLYPDESRS